MRKKASEEHSKSGDTPANLKTLFDVEVGDTVFRFLGAIGAPLPLRVSAVTEEQIICGDWQFDKRTGAEIDEFLGWGPALTGSYVLAVPFQVENN